MVHILVVEDDEKLNRIVCTYLNDSGFQAKGCLNAREAYDEMYNQLYDLIISDIMMPEIDGFEFARTVRKVNQRIPILFMSAKDDLPSKQKGFQLGIDDYMVKPVELDELVLRVRALLRRANIELERKITVGNLVLDADGMSAEVDGEEISLTTREFNIIYKLLSYPKKTFSSFSFCYLSGSPASDVRDPSGTGSAYERSCIEQLHSDPYSYHILECRGSRSDLLYKEENKGYLRGPSSQAGRSYRAGSRRGFFCVCSHSSHL